MVKRFQALIVGLLFASGCGAGGSPPPRQPQGEYERLRGSELTQAKELYAAGKPKEAAKILTSLAADENWEVRAHAISAIGRAKDGSLLPLVHAALSDDNLEVREAAGRALHTLADASSVGPLVTALRDPEPVIRMYAAEVLARVGGPAQIDALAEMAAGDPDPGVRSAAEEAVRQLRSPSGP